jgi:predicted phage terminase large subunit-like protein
MKLEIVAYQQGLYNLVRSEGAKRNIYPPLSPFKPDKDKIRRATIQSAQFSGNLVHLRDDHPLFQAFYDELVQFPLGEHDDMLDAYMNAAEEAVSKPRARTFAQKPSMFR